MRYTFFGAFIGVVILMGAGCAERQSVVDEAVASVIPNETVTLVCSYAQPASEPVICTKEYRPVCGYVSVQCITAPCPPVLQTFPNNCVAEANGAVAITEGTCEEREKNTGKSL